MSLSFDMLMKKATAQTKSASKEAAEILAQREAAQKKARLEQEQRDVKEREERKARLIYEMKKLEASNSTKELGQSGSSAAGGSQSSRDRDRLGASSRPSSSSGASSSNKKLNQVKDHDTAKSRSSSPRTTPYDRNALSREERRAMANPLLREDMLNAKKANKPRPKKGGGHFTSPSSKLNGQYASARDRIIAEHDQGGLIRLNTVKKDTRTIDEITRDLQRAKHGGQGQRTELIGDEAATFTDWFGKSKKEREKEAALEKERAKKEKERLDALAKEAASSAPSPSRHMASLSFSSSSTKVAASTLSTSLPAPRIMKPLPSSSTPRPATTNGLGSGSRPASSLGLRAVPSSSHSNGHAIPTAAPRKRTLDNGPHDSSITKRPKPSAAPAPQRRGGPNYDDDRDSYDSEVVSDEDDDVGGYRPGYIASLMGRNIERDAMREAALSDSEESDEGTGKGRSRKKQQSYGYDALMREEARSARIARKEDEEEEKRLKEHEESKKRKKEMARMGA